MIALTTTIESREWARKRRVENSLPPVHPRASSTDDVECFFSILRSTIGSDFTTTKVMIEWQKECLEFAKRINPDLPFYYYTTTHDRFYEGDRDGFDVFKKSRSNPRNQRVKTQEQPGQFPIGSHSNIIALESKTLVGSGLILTGAIPPLAITFRTVCRISWL